MNTKKILKIILVIVLALALLALLYIPGKAIVKNNVECRNEHNILRQQKQTEINELDNLEIFPNSGPKKAYVNVHGGCGSINPLGITISKTYDGDLKGAEALSSVRERLKAAGYTITSENFGSEGCKAIYRAEVTNNKTRFHVALSQEKNRISNCTDGYPTGLTEQVFSDQTIEKALITPKCGDSNCL